LSLSPNKFKKRQTTRKWIAIQDRKKAGYLLEAPFVVVYQPHHFSTLPERQVGEELNPSQDAPFII